MAQVGWNPSFCEGPFVAALMNTRGYCRVEVQYIGNPVPACPDDSIFSFCESKRLDMYGQEKIVSATVDHLNQEVRRGKIVLKGNSWVITLSPAREQNRTTGAAQ